MALLKPLLSDYKGQTDIANDPNLSDEEKLEQLEAYQQQSSATIKDQLTATIANRLARHRARLVAQGGPLKRLSSANRLSGLRQLRVRKERGALSEISFGTQGSPSSTGAQI